MSKARYRGWRYLYPGLDASEEFAGFHVLDVGELLEDLGWSELNHG